MTVEENCVRAKFAGSAQWHRGVNAEFAGFVAGGRDDAALIRASADDNGFAAQIGAIEEFHGDEEGIHVHVKNVRDGRRGKIIRVSMQGSKSRQVRHGISLRRVLLQSSFISPKTSISVFSESGNHFFITRHRTRTEKASSAPQLFFHRL